MTDDVKPADAPATETPAADTPAPEAPQPSADEAAIAAFDEGVKQHDAAEGGEPKADDPPAVEAVAKPDAPPDKDGAAATPPAEKTDEQKRDEAIEKEIADAKMKPATAERFRELSKRPSPEEVEKIVAPLREKAQQAEQWSAVLRESTARPDQLNNALGYLQAINSGDPVSMGKAYDVMLKELAWLGKMVGREVPGSYDPLSEHADLKKQVDEGDMPRGAALEIARHRAEATRVADLSRRQTEHATREQQEKAVFDKGIADLGALGTKLKAIDAEYARKLPLLQPSLAWARENLPPDKWVTYVEHAYSQIKLAPAATTPPVGTVPLRPTGSSANQHAKPKNDLEAFELGLASYRG